MGTSPVNCIAAVMWGETKHQFPVDMSRDPLRELERWISEHKAHVADIDSEDGYGAGSWTVSLGGVHIPKYKKARGTFGAVDWGELAAVTWHEGLLYVCPAAPGDIEPGLGATILAAIDQARRIAAGELQ